MNVGFHYKANAAARLPAPTVLPGALHQRGVHSGPNNGLIACLRESTAFVLVAGLLSLLLPRKLGPSTQPIRLDDIGDHLSCSRAILAARHWFPVRDRDAGLTPMGARE